MCTYGFVGFNRALCIVNLDIQKIFTRNTPVLIEHYVLLIFLIFSVFFHYFFVLIEHYVLLI